MCLILVAWDAHPVYQLVVAANRDEFFGRASAPMHWWPSRPVLAGRDLSVPDGGTWLSMSRTGRFAAVTNVRDFTVDEPPAPQTRGRLLVDFSAGDETPEHYVTSIDGTQFSGYNVLACDLTEMWWGSNHAAGPARVPPGIHGLSNAALDTAWPKVVLGKERLRAALAADDLDGYFELLANDTPAPDDELPPTGLDRERERLASAAFITSPDYGTNASTVLRVRRTGGFDVHERRFLAGTETGRVHFSGQIT